jgi:hypothetical protein
MTITSPKKSAMKVTEQLDDTVMASGSEPEDRSDGGSESERLLCSRSAEAFWRNRQTLLRDASTEFGKVLRQEDARQEDARQFHSAANDLPYLPTNIRDAVTQIGNLLDTNHDSHSHVEVHLSDAQSRQLLTISDLEVRETFRKVFLETSREKTKSINRETKSSLMTTINNHVTDTTIATIRVAHQLQVLSDLSESDGTVGVNTRIIMEADNIIDKEERLAGNMPQPISLQAVYQEVLDDWKPIGDKISLKLDNPCDELKRVASDLQTYLDTAEFIQSETNFSTAVYKEKVLKTVDDLYKQISVLHRVNQGPDGSPRNNNLAPGAYAFEVEGTQPWLLMILRLVSECATPPYTNVTERTEEVTDVTPAMETDSPNKLFPLTEKVVAAYQGSRSSRKCDFMLSKDQRYRPIVSDELMDLSIEAKPGSRTSHGPQALLNVATDQNLSQMAKSLSTAFNFAGAGVPSHATCLICNMAAVQVLHLCLENVGTPEVCLVLYKSDLHPLMSPSNYDKWAKSAQEARQKDFSNFRKLLFTTPTEDCNLAPTQIPSGYSVLLQLMQKRRMELFGPAVDATGDILGHLLGTGSASLVFQNLLDNSQAVKVSRYGGTRDIKNEVSILNKLKGKGSHPGIPKLIEHFDLEVTFGDLKRKLPACIIGPVGNGLLRVCSEKMESEMYSWLLLVLKNLQSALTFMHQHHIFHRDVNPKNAIIVSESDGVHRAVLIDYSIAFDGESGDVAHGFCGTINYSHRELFGFFQAKEFKPAAEHDLASLGFTMSALVNGGNVPWRSVVGFPKAASDPALFAATMEERFEMAGKLDNIATYKEVQEVQEVENLVQLVKDLLAYDKKTYGKVSTRKRNLE